MMMLCHNQAMMEIKDLVPSIDLARPFLDLQIRAQCPCFVRLPWYPLTAQKRPGRLLKHLLPLSKRLVLVKPVRLYTCPTNSHWSIELASRLKVANADSLRSIAGEIQAFNKRLTEATGRLPSYDQRQCELVRALYLILTCEVTESESN